MIGVNFQPGAQEFGPQNGNAKPSAGSGVQEAIRVLSLRLPKVQGANAAVPMPLMTSQGGGGNPRVDSVVQQVLSRIPQMQPQQAAPAPTLGMESMPSFSGTSMPGYQPQAPMPSFTMPTNPRVQIGNSPLAGTDADIRMPGDRGTPAGAVEPFPNFNIPSPPAPMPDVFGWMRNQPAGGGRDREDYSI